jgi:hypothetical protein
MARKYRIGPLDERTNNISDEGLVCRAYGHRWIRVPQPHDAVLKLARKGLAEAVRVCENGCGSQWLETYSLHSFETVESKRHYGDRSYLLPHGTGRLHRQEARKAEFGRMYPALV